MTPRPRILTAILFAITSAPALALAQTSTVSVASFPYSDHVGDSNFGAGYTTGLAVSATQSPSGNTTARNVNASAWGRVFGATFNVASASMSATSNAGTSESKVNAHVVIGPFTVPTKSFTGPFTNANLTLFDSSQNVGGAHQTFMVGPVPVSVGIDFDVHEELYANGTLGQFGGVFFLTPTAGITTTVSAGLGSPGLAEVGVKGYLDLMTVAVRVEGAANWRYSRGTCAAANLDQLSGGADLSLGLTSLDGYLSLFAELGPAEWDYTIPGTTWTGWSKTIDLYTTNGTWNFAPVAAAPAGAPPVPMLYLSPITCPPTVSSTPQMAVRSL